MALWKAKLGEEEEDRSVGVQIKRTSKFSLKAQGRRGADTVIKNVLPFLLFWLCVV